MDLFTWKIAAMATEKQLEANRRNVLKSTGPKTSEGKARSSKNAIKHGLTSETDVLDDENADELETLVESWVADLRPRNIAEKALVTRAAQSCWRLERCFRAERAQEESMVRHAAEAYDLGQCKRAQDLGRSLLDDPLNRCIIPPKDKETHDALASWNAVEPSLVVKELESFSQGAVWLIERYRELGTILETEGFWHYPEKYLAIRLLGKRPEDALRDREIAKIFMACRALHPEPWDATADFQQAVLGQKGRPVYAVRVEYLETYEKMNLDEAFDHLKYMIRSRVADLETLLHAKLNELDAIQRDLAVETAMFDTNKRFELTTRYETAREREVSRSMNLYLKLRKLDPDDSPTVCPPQPKANTAPKPVAPNEPELIPSVTEVAEPVYSVAELNLKKSDPDVPPGVSRGNRRKKPLDLIKQGRKSATDAQEVESGQLRHDEPSRDTLKRPKRGKHSGSVTLPSEPS